MHSVKSNFTREYKQKVNETGSAHVWQKRFWDHVIRDERDFENDIHYIHYNPVKHGYVDDPGIDGLTAVMCYGKSRGYMKIQENG